MRSIDSAIKKAAIEWNIPEDQAKPIIMEYWETIYRKIVGGKFTAITARHIGTFAMSRYKLNINIRKTIKTLRRIKANNNIEPLKKEKIISDFEKKLKLALKHRNEIAIRYAQNFGNI